MRCLVKASRALQRYFELSQTFPQTRRRCLRCSSIIPRLWRSRLLRLSVPLPLEQALVLNALRISRALRPRESWCLDGRRPYSINARTKPDILPFFTELAGEEFFFHIRCRLEVRELLGICSTTWDSRDD